MDTERLIELVPHYIAMVVLAYAALAVVRLALGDIGFWPELVVLGAVVFVYRPAVMRLGLGPSAWERG